MHITIIIDKSTFQALSYKVDIPRKETHSFRIKLTHQIFFPD